MITIRITGPGMDVHLGVESLEDMVIVDAAMLRVREHVATSPLAKEVAKAALAESTQEQRLDDA